MKLIIAYLSLTATSVVSATLMCFIFHSLNKGIAIASLAIGLLTFLFILSIKHKISSGIEKKDFSFWSVITIVVFFLFSLRAFIWLAFQVRGNIRVLSPNNLGDLSLHISFIKYLANGPAFWPDNHIFTGDKIHYPIGMDLFNSLLILINVDLIHGLVWVGLLGAIACGVALFIWGRAFVLAGFLFSGGLAGFKFFQTLEFADYQADLAWKSLPLAMLVTQRGLLYALPAGLLLLSSWRNRFFLEENNKFILPLWLEVLLYTSMPIFHMHTFIILSLLLGIWFFLVSQNKRFHIVRLVLLSFPLAVFFIFLLVDFSNTSSFLSVKLGWMQEKENFFVFWLHNFGIFWPLIILILCLELPGVAESNKFNLINYLDSLKKFRTIFYPALLLFIVFSNIMLTPWDWDSCKFLIWPYLILLLCLWEILICKWDYQFKYWACFLLFLSGFVCIHGGFKSVGGFEIYKVSEVIGVSKATENLPMEERFATYPTYNHPVLLSGRKVVLGYPGWIWSHGYQTKGKDKKLEDLMRGKKDWRDLAKELGVRYIFWGNLEAKNYSNSTKPWKDYGTLIASGDWGEIYDLEYKKGQETNFETY